MMDVLLLASRSGIDLTLDGDDLVLEAAVPPPAEVLDLLRQHKTTVVALLSQTDDPDLAEELREERLAIREADGPSLLDQWRAEADQTFNPDPWR